MKNLISYLVDFILTIAIVVAFMGILLFICWVFAKLTVLILSGLFDINITDKIWYITGVWFLFVMMLGKFRINFDKD